MPLRKPNYLPLPVRARPTEGSFPDDALQHPLLDDNGDGSGACSPGGDADQDGYLSRGQYIGVSSVTANDPGDVQVSGVSAPQFLGVSHASAGFWARVDDNDRLRSIWLEVKPPGYIQDTGVKPPSEQIALELPRYAFNAYNAGLDRYEWDPLAEFNAARDLQNIFLRPRRFKRQCIVAG